MFIYVNLTFTFIVVRMRSSTVVRPLRMEKVSGSNPRLALWLAVMFLIFVLPQQAAATAVSSGYCRVERNETPNVSASAGEAEMFAHGQIWSWSLQTRASDAKFTKSRARATRGRIAPVPYHSTRQY